MSFVLEVLRCEFMTMGLSNCGEGSRYVNSGSADARVGIHIYITEYFSCYCGLSYFRAYRLREGIMNPTEIVSVVVLER